MSRIGLNTLALTASFFSTALLGLIWYKIITTSMSQEEVGLFVSLFATGAMLGTFTEMGLPQVLVRFGARFDAQGNVPRFHRLILLALKVYAGGLVVMSLLLVLGGEGLVDLFSRTLNLGSLNPKIVLLAYLALSSGTIRAINNAGFRGLRQMTWIPILETLFSFLITVAYFSFRNHLSAEMCLIIFWVCSAGVGLLGLGVLFRLVRRLSPQETQERGEGLVAEIAPYWKGVAPSGVLLIAVEQVDKILIPAILTLQSNAIFAVISRFANVPRRLLYQPMQVMNPEVTRKWEQGRGQELRQDLHLFIKLQLGLGLALMVPIAILAKPLIALVSTSEYVQGAPALWIFCFVLPMLTMHQPLLMMLRAIGQVWYAFAGDALWIVSYLVMGVILSRAYDLTGFVAGQVVASLLVLFYTLWAFHRLALPRPSVRAFAGWLGLSILIWGASVALGRTVPHDLPWWAVLLVVPACLIVLNVLFILGGFLSRHEIDRTIGLMAGHGGMARIARTILLWPLRLKGRGSLIVLLGVLTGVTGCQEKLQHGCSCDEDVPKQVREQIELAADTFFQRIQTEDAQGIFENAAEPIRTKSSVEKLVGPVAQQVFQFGYPTIRTTRDLRVIHLVSGQPVESPMRCYPKDKPVEKMNFHRHPDQASLVQTWESNGKLLAYSTLWWLEEGEWRLGGFEVGAVSIFGNDWHHYDHLADEQATKGNLRNAVLLYNLAMDLMVPNDWTRPEALLTIEAKQRGVPPMNLPKGNTETWSAEGIDFDVFRVTPDFSDDELALAVFASTEEDVTDSLLMAVRTKQLFEHVGQRFTEYKEVFGGVHVVMGGLEDQSTLGFSAKFAFGSND